MSAAEAKMNSAVEPLEAEDGEPVVAVIDSSSVVDRASASDVSSESSTPVSPEALAADAVPADDISSGTIGLLRQGFGFIDEPGAAYGLYFYRTDVVGNGLGALQEGITVCFVRSSNNRGPCARNVTPVDFSSLQRS